MFFAPKTVLSRLVPVCLGCIHHTFDLSLFLSQTLACKVLNNRIVWFEDFSDLSSNVYSACNNKAMSGSFPWQKFQSPSRFPSLFLSSLELLSVPFLLAKLGERVALWFTLTTPPLKKMIDGTEKPQNPSQFSKRAARYWNEFGHEGLRQTKKMYANELTMTIWNQPWLIIALAGISPRRRNPEEAL